MASKPNTFVSEQNRIVESRSPIIYSHKATEEHHLVVLWKYGWATVGKIDEITAIINRWIDSDKHKGT